MHCKVAIRSRYLSNEFLRRVKYGLKRRRNAQWVLHVKIKETNDKRASVGISFALTESTH